MSRSLIIVEGENDKKFIHALAARMGSAIADELIRPAGSKSDVKSELKAQLKSTHLYNTVSVVLDADDNPDGTWQSILNILIQSGKYNVSLKTPMPAGGIIFDPKDSNDIRIGVWIMPNNQNAGMLEDFVATLMQDGDKVYEKAQNTIADLDAHREMYDHLFKHVHLSKAVIYTWLAWHDSPEQTMGQAVQKNLFDDLKLQSENCQNFISWLRQVA